MTSLTASLRELSEPWPSGSKVKEAIDRASKRSGLPFWRTFDIWYGKARWIRDFEIEAVVSALEKRQRETARNELHELKTRLAILEGRLSQIDPDFHRETINQTREQVRRARGVDRT